MFSDLVLVVVIEEVTACICLLTFAAQCACTPLFQFFLRTPLLHGMLHHVWSLRQSIHIAQSFASLSMPGSWTNNVLFKTILISRAEEAVGQS